MISQMLREKRLIAFFGGTFDPPHGGHLEMAKACLHSLPLHRVCFVPAGRNPFKQDGPMAAPQHRLGMLQAMSRENPRLGVWEGELHREGPSYTIESILHIERVYPNAHLFWIIGSDQLAGLAGWRDIGELVHRVGFILVHRPGHPFLWPGVPGLRVYPVENPLMEVSATEVRRRIAQGLSLDGLLPAPVARYIDANGLYRS